MEFSTFLQLAATVATMWGAFSAYRARDNERAAALSEIRSDVKHIMKRLDRIEQEKSIQRIEMSQREESA